MRPDIELVRQLIEGMAVGAPATSGEIAKLTSSFGGITFPPDYLDFLRLANGAEGYVGGGAYLALWSSGEVQELNRLYQVNEFAPGLVLLGTDAALVGYGAVDREPSIVEVDLIGMSRERIRPLSCSFADFLYTQSLRIDGPTGNGARQPPPWLRGQHIYEITPIIFGGDPADPQNKKIVPRRKHAELAAFWNKKLRDLEGDRGVSRQR